MGFADLWNGDVKVANDAERQRMSEEKERHTKGVEVKERHNSDHVSELYKQERQLEKQFELQREEAKSKEQILWEVQKEMKELHESRYTAMSIDNKNRLEKFAEKQEEKLKNEQIRENEEVQKMADRIMAENFHLEKRQKEIEAKLGEDKKAAEKVQQELNELMIGEGQKYSEKLDRVQKENGEELRKVKEEQNRAVLDGDRILAAHQANVKALNAADFKAKQELLVAHHQDNDASVKKVHIDNLKRNSRELSQSASSLYGKIDLCMRTGKRSPVTIHDIKNLALKCKKILTILLDELDSPALRNIDSLDSSREETITASLDKLAEVGRILEPWVAIAQDTATPEEVISIFGKDYKEFNDHVKNSTEEVREIPYPKVEHESVGAVISRNINAVLNNAIGTQAVGTSIQSVTPASQMTIRSG